jgi:putative ABC transport system permease protein
VRNLLVILEVAVSLVLLTSAGLLVKSFINLQRVDPGFNPDNVLTMRLSLPFYKYAQPDQQRGFTAELLQRVKHLPGVESAAISTALPLSTMESASSFLIEGQPPPSDGSLPIADFRTVSPDYFQVLHIPVLKGRVFTDADTKDVQNVAVVNQTMARNVFGDQDAIGKRIFIGGDKNASEIVGIVGDVRHSSLDSEPKPEMYVTYLQAPPSFYTLAVRTKLEPTSMVGAVRNEVLAIDKDQPVSVVKTMAEMRSESLAALRFNTVALSIFAGLGLILAAVGIYGVMAYSVGQRTHELGIRMALGAQPGAVLRLVLGQGMLLVLIGVVLGLVLSFGMTRIMASFLYGVTAHDPATFVFVAIALSLVALLANYIPARRATKVDPLIALRNE